MISTGTELSANREKRQLEKEPAMSAILMFHQVNKEEGIRSKTVSISHNFSNSETGEPKRILLTP